MTKEEKIKEAWGEYWDIVSKHHQYEGWVNRWVWDFRNDLEMEELSGKNIPSLVRPKSLQGIENNNGWKILNKDSELKECKYYVICNGRVDIMSYFKGYFYDFDQKYKPLSEVTHYDEYIERKHPIY